MELVDHLRPLHQRLARLGRLQRIPADLHRPLVVAVDLAAEMVDQHLRAQADAEEAACPPKAAPPASRSRAARNRRGRWRSSGRRTRRRRHARRASRAADRRAAAGGCRARSLRLAAAARRDRRWRSPDAARPESAAPPPRHGTAVLRPLSPAGSCVGLVLWSLWPSRTTAGARDLARCRVSTRARPDRRRSARRPARRCCPPARGARHRHRRRPTASR